MDIEKFEKENALEVLRKIIDNIENDITPTHDIEWYSVAEDRWHPLAYEVPTIINTTHRVRPKKKEILPGIFINVPLSKDKLELLDPETNVFSICLKDRNHPVEVLTAKEALDIVSKDSSLTLGLDKYFYLFESEALEVSKVIFELLDGNQMP